MEKKEPVSWTLLDCLTVLRDSWNDVKPSTIQNCFLHCGFKTQTPPLEDDDPEDDLPLAQLRANLKASNVHLNDEHFHIFLEADDEVTTSGSLTTDDIIDSITSDNTSQESDPDSDDDDPVPTAPPTFAEAMESISTIRHYLMTASKPLPRDDPSTR